MYKVNGVEYDCQSSKNQKILERLVQNGVYCCMTPEMEYMLSKVYDYDDDNPFDESDLEKFLVIHCPECGCTSGFEELEVSQLEDESFESDDDTFCCPSCGREYTTLEEARDCCSNDIVYRCTDCGKVLDDFEYNNLESEPEEIFEWWAVANWFGDKLEEQGCVVIKSWGKSYWGRTTTGQSISLDGCIANIAKDMKILDGMEYCWD